MKNIYVLVLFICFGCSHFQRVEDTDFSPVEKSWFSPCGDLNNGGYLNIYTKKNKLFGADIEWVSEKNGSSKIHLLSPIGNPIMQLYSKNNEFKLKSAVSRKAPRIEINKLGFYSIDGWWVGINYKELPCFLSNKIPSSWKKNIYKREVTRNKIIYTGKHQGRRFIISSDKHTTKSDQEINREIMITWPKFLYLGTNTVKITSKSALNTTIEVNKDHQASIKWRKEESVL